MGLSADDAFLNAIAHQARVAYATQQLAVYRDALQRWQADGAPEASDGMCAHDVAYYTQQLERWQGYLGSLEEVPKVLKGCEMPLL